MATGLSRPGAEPKIHSTTEINSVSAFTTKDAPLKLVFSTVPVTSTMKREGEHRFPLLSLPLELRREVYRHYFISSTTTNFSSAYHLVQAGKHCNLYCLRKCHTEILTANRQIYSEARDVLYGITIWHISFKALHWTMIPDPASDASLQAFRSRPEFQLVQHITVGVMFNTNTEMSVWTSIDTHRLKINRELLQFICETLIQAPKLLTLQLLWHDRIEHGDWEEKRHCLTALARLPERVKCTVFLGVESGTVHYRGSFEVRLSLSAQEQAAKADLNRHLQTVRQQYQASSRCKTTSGIENTSPMISNNLLSKSL